MSELFVLIAAAGALGTAAFGIVEAAKWFPFVGEAGYSTLMSILEGLRKPLAAAYGTEVDRLLRAQYRGETQDLVRVIRQGARLGLTPENAAVVAASLDLIDKQVLHAAADAQRQGTPLTLAQKNALSRLELAIDARIETGVTLSHAKYMHAMQLWAMAVAIVLAFVAGWYQEPSSANWSYWGKVVIVGLVAVPIAPIAKDLVDGLKSATEGIRARV